MIGIRIYRDISREKLAVSIKTFPGITHKLSSSLILIYVQGRAKLLKYK